MSDDEEEMARMRRDPRYLSSAAAQIHNQRAEPLLDTQEQQSSQLKPAASTGSYLAQFRKRQKPAAMQGATSDKNGANNFVAGLASMTEVELIQRAGYLQRQEDENTGTEQAGDSSELAEQR